MVLALIFGSRLACVATFGGPVVLMAAQTAFEVATGACLLVGIAVVLTCGR